MVIKNNKNLNGTFCQTHPQRADSDAPSSKIISRSILKFETLSPNRVVHKTQNLFCVGVQELYYQKVKTDFSQTRHEKESLAQLVRPTSAVASTCFSVNETSAEVV